MIERQLFKVPTLLQGLDSCMKTYFLFDFDFPTECKHIWNFVANVGFNLIPEAELSQSAKILKSFVSK